MQITVAVPDDARWMTTDSDGDVALWKSDARRPRTVGGSWYSGRNLYDGLLVRYRTGIPCPTWRDSLVELKPENENG